MSSRIAYITRKMHKIVENLTSEDFYTSLSPHFAATAHAKKNPKKTFFHLIYSYEPINSLGNRWVI